MVMSRSRPTVHRRPPRPVRRRPAALALMVAFGLALAAGATSCGGDDSASPTTQARTSNERRTTTSSASTTSTVPSSSPTTGPTTTGPGATVAGGAPAPADVERTDPTWALNAVEFRGQDGRRVAVTCAANGALGSVWGSGPYTDDSSICTAGVHAGVITQAGGRVVVEIRPGEPTYQGTQAHGVTSSDYGSWSGSYVVLGA
jgi:hypothetical protein